MEIIISISIINQRNFLIQHVHLSEICLLIAQIKLMIDLEVNRFSVQINTNSNGKLDDPNINLNKMSKDILNNSLNFDNLQMPIYRNHNKSVIKTDTSDIKNDKIQSMPQSFEFQLQTKVSSSRIQNSTQVVKNIDLINIEPAGSIEFRKHPIIEKEPSKPIFSQNSSLSSHKRKSGRKHSQVNSIKSLLNSNAKKKPSKKSITVRNIRENDREAFEDRIATPMRFK